MSDGGLFYVLKAITRFLAENDANTFTTNDIIDYCDISIQALSRNMSNLVKWGFIDRYTETTNNGRFTHYTIKVDAFTKVLKVLYNE